MSGAYEGDLIRPLGLVTLYAAYAEGEVDELLNALPSKEPFDEKKRQWPIGRKLAYAQRLVRGLKSQSLAGLSVALTEARELFERRNALVHGRIYAGGRLVSNRVGIPNQSVSPEEIVDLAERIFSCKEHINVHRSRHLLPFLAASAKQPDA